ncbi:MAG: Rieske 2Fe-2S domain-containing protein [Rhodospirillales bacterium]|nr:Rieske 2Fe-2S domain-containing protein [Rhodospirillales bacterium]MDP6883870.1 Rieske 2Fe-2S domain-containing protein [Rhodospirillales bacterium]
MPARERTKLCRLDDIADGGSERFVAQVNGQARGVMAIRQGARVFVYVNDCPHTGAPLDFTPGKFLNLEGTHILCTGHGALFRIEDGHCVSGPCVGDDLQALDAVVEDDAVWVTG